MAKKGSTGPPARPAGRTLLFASVFFLNLLALAGQVLWLRQLSCLFGSTAAVSSTVLSVFLLGLAFGARWAGRRSDRSSDPFRALGRLLMGLGTYCLLSLPLFAFASRSLASILPDDLSPFPAGLARLSTILALLFAPAAATGASFPLSVRAAGSSPETLGRDLALLFGLDALGAAFGALLAGFVLVPLFGLTLASRALGAAALALSLLLLNRRGARRRRPEDGTAEKRRARPPAGPRAGVALSVAEAPDPRGHPLLLGALFATGAGGLLLATGWLRFFSQLSGTHLYSTSSVVAGILLGIGLGSLVMARQIERLRNPRGFASALFALVALGGLAVFRGEDLFTRYYFGLFHATSAYIPFQLAICAGIGVLVFLATLPMGASFPLVARLSVRDLPARGEGAGQAFFCTALGALLGALASVHLVLPAWGFSGLALLVLLLYGGAAAVFLSASPRQRRGAADATTACALLAAALWSPLLSPFRAPLHALFHDGLRLGSLAAFEREASRMQRIEQRQGLYGQVAVLRDGPSLLLKVNGRTEASSSPVEHQTQALLGHLPLLFNPAPARVLILGLEGGFTLQAVVQHPEPLQVTVVEVDPLVVEMARRHFDSPNGHALEDPRVRVAIDEGRRFVAASSGRYDVISSGPLNLTQEFYRAASSHLNRRGVFCQSIPLAEVKKDDFRTLLHTLTSVFPFVTFWQIGTDVVFLASNEALGAEQEEVANRLRRPAVRSHLAAFALTPEDLMTLLNDPVARPDQVSAFLGPIETLQTDDRPVLEFSIARNLYTLARRPR